MLDETFERPDGFDLARAWVDHSDGGAGPRRPRWSSAFRAEPGRSAMFQRVAGQRIRGRGEGDTVVLDFPAEEAAAGFLASLGSSIEVLDPPGVRRHLAEIGRQLAAQPNRAPAAPGLSETMPCTGPIGEKTGSQTVEHARSTTAGGRR